MASVGMAVNVPIYTKILLVTMGVIQGIELKIMSADTTWSPKGAYMEIVVRILMETPPRRREAVDGVGGVIMNILHITIKPVSPSRLYLAFPKKIR